MSRRIFKAAAAIPLLLLAVLAAGCGSRDAGGEEYPRPKGWPRLHDYPADYIAVAAGTAGLPLAMEVNSHAALSRRTGGNGAAWLDIAYPAYGVTVYLTVTPAASAEEAAEAVENRLERFSLDNPGAAGHTPVASSDGCFRGVISVAVASATPVQFVVSNGKNCVVSATAHFSEFSPGDISRTDSVAPAVDTILRDLLHTIESLHTESLESK